MKKIIPFKKQLSFKTNLSEITSISLENTLQNKDQTIEGDLIVSGSYKITDTSTQTETFEFRIPINIEIDNKYIIDNMVIDINDFYYEIINSSILEVNIEISLDDIIEKTYIEEKESEPMKEEKSIEEQVEKKQEYIEKQERCIEEEIELPKEENNINKIIGEIKEDEDDFTTYYIYIMRENDTIESVIEKYNTTKEQLEEYNTLTEIKLGDKIIIPETNARN